MAQQRVTHQSKRRSDQGDCRMDVLASPTTGPRAAQAQSQSPPVPALIAFKNAQHSATIESISSTQNQVRVNPPRRRRLPIMSPSFSQPGACSTCCAYRKGWLLLILIALASYDMIANDNGANQQLGDQASSWSQQLRDAAIANGLVQKKVLGSGNVNSRSISETSTDDSSDNDANSNHGPKSHDNEAFSYATLPKWPTVQRQQRLKASLKKASQSVQKDFIIVEGSSSYIRNNHRQNQNHRIEFYWQLPPHTTRPKAILFLAHGCSHAGSDWWPHSQQCPECLGLPEERAIVKMAHQAPLDMVTVALSASESFRKCWKATDGPRVAAVLTQFQLLFPNIPTFALGASSGGYFVSSILPQALNAAAAAINHHHLPGSTVTKVHPLAGFVSEIAAPNLADDLTGDQAPSGVFITMAKDDRTFQHVHSFVDAQQQKAKEGGSRVKHIPVQAHSISPMYFHERIPEISTYLSEKLTFALKQYTSTPMVHNETFELLMDPRRDTRWKEAIRPVLEEAAAAASSSSIPSFASSYKDSLIADHSPMTEVMNVAWSMHEMTRDGVPEALDFLISQYEQSQLDQAEKELT